MPATPGREQAAASSGSPDGEKATAAAVAGAHRRAAGAAASACTLVSGDHAAAPGPACAILPLASRASRRPLPGAAARASGTSARPPSSTAGRQLVPLSPLLASGENARSWLGRKPAMTDRPPRPASTRPPLLATPGGVTSRHAADLAGRTKSCQKLSCRAAGPPSTATAHVPPAVAREVARPGGGRGAVPGLPWLVTAPQAAAVMASTVAASGQRGAPAHHVPSACRAALASSTANDDREAVVPGPGSMLISWRMRPSRPIT